MKNWLLILILAIILLGTGVVSKLVNFTIGVAAEIIFSFGGILLVIAAIIYFSSRKTN